MTSKEKVLAVHPDAVWVPQYGAIYDDSETSRERLSGSTWWNDEEAAWQNAADSLPAAPEHCPNCNHKAHYALRCGALIATGSDGEFAEEVRCECLNWVAEPKPTPSSPEPSDMQKQMAHDDGLITTLQEDTKRLRKERAEWQRKYFEISRALSGTIDKNGDLIKRIQWLEHEKDEIRNGKPQPDSSSISTERPEPKQSMTDVRLAQEIGMRDILESQREAFIELQQWRKWAKGQSNGR